MLEAIRDFMRRHTEPRVAPAPGAESSTPATGVAVAACALLLEVAHADGEFAVVEQQRIESALERHFGLDESTRRELVALAEAERRQSVDHFQFTRLINQHFDLGQKMVLAELMWGVVLADGEIAKHEAYLVRKLASLLELPPAYLAQARRRADPQT